MKKTLLFAFIAAAAIIGCSRNEVTPLPNRGEAIDFRTVIGKQTKVTETTNISLQGDANGYQSVAYVTEKKFAENDAALKVYFNQAIKFTDTEWAAAEILYWPSTGYMNVFSYYPNVAKNTTNVVYTDAKYETPTLTYPSLAVTVSNVLADQVDILATNSLNNEKADPVDNLTVNFNHILSQLYFKAKPSDASYKVKVKSLSVEGASKSATFTYDGSATIGAWSNNVGSNTYAYRTTTFPTESDSYISSATVPTAIESESNGGSLMVIPQGVSDAFKLTVVYDVYTPTNYLLAEDVTKAAQMDQLEKGKKYAYVLTLPADAVTTPITFSVDMSEWDAEVVIEQSYAKFELTSTESEYGTKIASLVDDFVVARKDFAAGATYINTIKVTETNDNKLTKALTVDVSAIAPTDLAADDAVVLDFSSLTTIADLVTVTVTTGDDWTATPTSLTTAGVITLKKK